MYLEIDTGMALGGGGGGWEAPSLFLRDSTSSRPKGPPFVLFLDILFGDGP